MKQERWSNSVYVRVLPSDKGTCIPGQFRQLDQNISLF